MVWSINLHNISYDLPTIGGSKGGRQGHSPPPEGPNSFNFMQFLGEN